MRERLVASFVALSVCVVGVFLIERAYTTSSLIEAQERGAAARSAETIAALVGAQGEPPTTALLTRVLHNGERVVYVDGGGRRVEADRRTATDAASGESDLVETRPVPGGGTVTFSRQSEFVEAEVAGAMLPLVLIALGVLAAAVLAAVLLARRLARPFGELADVAGQIGRGAFDVDVPRYDVPEADAVARALRASAHDLDSLVRRERDFAVHASHELNTPITAMRLELEDLALAPGTPADVVAGLADALGQLDRLSASVAGMLDASRASRLGSAVDIDLTALVRDTVQRWQGLTPTRRLEGDCHDVVAVRMPAGAVMQVMDVLLGNAVTHGEGTIRVGVTSRAAYAEITVADEGPRSHAEGRRGRPVTGGVGGLATAIEIAESLGGRLRLAEDDRTTYSLVLPLSRRPLAAQAAHHVG